MSEENVEVVRRAYEHLSKTGKALPELLDPQVEFSLAWNEGRGREAFQKAIDEWTETFENWSIEAKEIVAAGPNQVIATVRDLGKPRGSPAPIDNEFFHLWALEDGRAASFRTFTEKQQAVEAAGLSD